MADNQLRYATNQEGEKVIPATRRADGSLRPERRVREGFLPQEEQPLYKSRGALERRGVPVCPGADFVAEQKPGTSKSAKKNERRRKKKQGEEQNTEGDVEQLTQEIGGLSLEEKELRALRKKVRQCEALEARKAAGETLTQPEIDKLSKLPQWQEQILVMEPTQL